MKTKASNILWYVFYGLAVLIIVASFTLLICVAGCEPSPPPAEIREVPIAYHAFESMKSVREDGEEKGYLSATGYYEQGEEITIPGKWRGLPILVPMRGTTVAYHFDWAPTDGEFKPIAVVVVDSLDSGVMWFAVYGAEDGDRFRMEIVYPDDSLDVPTGIE